MPRPKVIIPNAEEFEEDKHTSIIDIDSTLSSLISVFDEVKALLLFTNEVICDAPRAWGLYFQDSASPQMEALVELHDNIMYYLVAILFAVGWIQGAIIRNFDSSRSPISNKYLNHGIKKSVPAQKCSKIKWNSLLNFHRFSVRNPIFFFKKKIVLVRTYSTSISKDNSYSSNGHITPSVVYEDAYSMKKAILKENKGKAGIYMLTNKLTGDIYVGQSIDLRKRFIKYFSLSYITSRKELIISRALIKYGYSNFSVTILEYCIESELDVKEQYYFDKLNPQYNIQKIAGGSSKGLKLSEETKSKISKSLKGVYASFLPRVITITKRTYSSQSDTNGLPKSPRSRVLAQYLGINPIFYEDSSSLRELILKENKGKSGIYMWTNKITGDIYIGQSVDLAERLKRYYYPNYLEKNKSLLISRALMKYGHASFSTTILEYCEKSELNEREQYYLDNLEPDYNILKTAGSFLGYTFTDEDKVKISKGLKGIKRSEDTKELMRQKALGRKPSEDVLLKISTLRGTPVNLYEKCDTSGFKLIGSFVSHRKVATFLGMSHSTVLKYVNSGAIYKDRYKFSTS